MRNLKRLLSLALASVMVLGLMIVGSSAKTADFEDADSINKDYAEAIDVLTTIGLLDEDGTGNGSFEPQGHFTRAMAAKIIATMMLGAENAEKLPANKDIFKDIDAATAAWASGYITYCANNGFIAGDGSGNFNPNADLTGVQLGKLLLVALGYDAKTEGFVENPSWAVNVASAMVSVEIDVDGMSFSDPVTREQAAQMILNTIESPLVEYTGKTEVNVNGAQIVVGGNEATYKTSTIAKEQTISRLMLSNTGPTVGNTPVYTVEFGERFISNLVKSSNETDDFGRPAYSWTYKNEDIGTYIDSGKYVDHFLSKVTGGDIWNLIGSVAADYPLDYYIDGMKQSNSAAITATLARKNATALVNDKTPKGDPATGDGVLTEVYVDDSGNGKLTIVVINTYLAKSTADYSEAKEYAPLTVYLTDSTGHPYNIDKDDVPEVVNVVDDTYYLVNISKMNNSVDGEVVNIEDVEILSDSTVTKFSSTAASGGEVTKLTTGGTEYKKNLNAHYDVSVLGDYSQDKLTDTTYNVYLDQYDNFIGVDVYEGAKHYVFITGYDMGKSNLSVKTADANAIFLDGTMKNIEVDVTKTNNNITDNTKNGKFYEWKAYEDWHQYAHARWYSYTVNSTTGVYTLKPADMILQDCVDDAITIKTSNVSIKDSWDSSKTRVYGEDDSVYITVEQGKVDTSTTDLAITKVTGTYTGVQDVEILSKTNAGANNTAPIYAVYDSKDYHIIGAVVIGKARGSTKDIVYVISKIAKTEAIVGDDYQWTFDAIVNGEIVQLTAKTDYPSSAVGGGDKILNATNRIVRLRYDNEGFVVGGDELSDDEIYNMKESGEKEIGTEDLYYISINKSQSSKITLYADGRTFNYKNDKASSPDYGLALVKDAPAVVIQTENGVEEVKTAFTSVKAAIAHLANGGDGFYGYIYGILNAAGAAEWMVFVPDKTNGITTGSSTNTGSGDSGNITVGSVGYNTNANRYEVEVTAPADIKDGDTYNVTISDDQNFKVTTGTKKFSSEWDEGNVITLRVPYSASVPAGTYTIDITLTISGTAYTFTGIRVVR